MKPFLQKLLGMGDIEGLAEKVTEMGLHENEELLNRLKQGELGVKRVLSKKFSHFRTVHSARHVRAVLHHHEHGTHQSVHGKLKIFC